MSSSLPIDQTVERILLETAYNDWEGRSIVDSFRLRDRDDSWGGRVLTMMDSKQPARVVFDAICRLHQLGLLQGYYDLADIKLVEDQELGEMVVVDGEVKVNAVGKFAAVRAAVTKGGLSTWQKEQLSTLQLRSDSIYSSIEELFVTHVDQNPRISELYDDLRADLNLGDVASCIENCSLRLYRRARSGVVASVMVEHVLDAEHVLVCKISDAHEVVGPLKKQ